MTFFRLKIDLGIIIIKSFFVVITLLCIVILAPETAESKIISLYQSVEQALKYSPQLQALTHSHQAAQFDLKQSRGRYLPSIDLLLGYGIEQHSDSATRRDGSDPSDKDWDSRGDATLRLTQKVYDGGETSQQIAIQKILLDSALFQIQNAAQAVALDAIAAHLDIFRQHELVALAEKNLAVHQNIYKSLAERVQAGAGDITNVTQAQARQARAQSALYLSKADLNKALANYIRMVGISPDPENVTYAGVPGTLPKTLEQALELMAKQNTELLILTTTLAEFDAKVNLAQSTYKPKIDIQLSSRYNDQLEGDRSWQNTNYAMLNLRWNLFNGGQDKAGKKATLSRKHQSYSARNDKLLELQEATSATWATYKSLHGQKIAYRDAVKYSQKTFDAYVNQFSVSQRSLLDVLIIANDYFQSASQLITITVNETLAAYRILSLIGDLQVPQGAGFRECPEELKWLKQALVLPSITPSVSPAPQKERFPKQGIRVLINRWAAAWVAQDVAGYMACYSNQFTPENGQSYQEWQQSRISKLTVPTFIDIAITDLQVHPLSGAGYQADFSQSYRSNKHNDQVNKKLLLKFQNKKWQIISEQSTPDTDILTASFLQEPDIVVVEGSAQKKSSRTNIVPAYSVQIGPCINKREVEQVRKILRSLKLKFSQKTGTGKVTMVRLLEGIYPAKIARKKLIKVKKKIKSAYLLPAQNKRLGLYMGTFYEKQRAVRFAEKLGTMGFTTKQITIELERLGETLISQQTDKETAQLIQQRMADLNVTASIVYGN